MSLVGDMLNFRGLWDIWVDMLGEYLGMWFKV